MRNAPRGRGPASETSRPALDGLLNVGALVETVDRLGIARLHRVYAITATDVHVSAALDQDVQVAMPVLLRWGGARGMHEVDLGDVAASEDGAEWVLPLAGSLRTTQRREHARAAAALPVVLATEAGIARGITIDLSEGGLCCVLVQGHRPEPGEPVRVAIETDDVETLLTGEIVRIPTDHDGKPVVVVHFLQPNPAEKWLRRQVLRWQVLARQVDQS